MHTLSAPPSTVGHRARPPHPLAHLSGPRTLLLLVGLVAAAECGLLVVYGVALWRHFDLGSDDAIANQATWLIAHGTLSPFDTIFTDTFWRDTFGLIWWPLAVARVAFSSGLSLLVEQAAAISATTFALGRLAVVRSRDLRPGARLVLFTGASALALLNPWAFEAFSFSVHSEPIGALGLVLSGALEQRRWLLGVGLGLALLSGSALIVTALGLGVGLLCLPSLRRSGAVVTVAAVAFLAADVALGAHRGFSFAAQYGYLVGRHPEHVGVGAVVRAVVAHPGRATHVLARRHASILHLIVDGGVLGLFFPPSLLPVLVDVPINALTIGGNFISRVEGFQNWPEVVLLLAGGVEGRAVAPPALLAGGPLGDRHPPPRRVDHPVDHESPFRSPGPELLARSAGGVGAGPPGRPSRGPTRRGGPRLDQRARPFRRSPIRVLRQRRPPGRPGLHA